MSNSNQTPHKGPRRDWRRPYVLALKLAAAVFTAEAAVMWVLTWLDLPKGPVGSLLDAALLTILSLPCIYVLVVRPLQRTESSLRASEEWLSTTLKSIGDAVIATDARGHVKFLNVVAQELTGWTHDDAAGRPLADIFVIVNERTGEPAESPITKVLQEGVTVGLANHTALISKDGTRRAIDDSGAPLRDEQGRVLGAVLCFRDITDRRRAEEAARMANEELLERRREEHERVEAELANVRDELIRKTRLAAIGQVSASIAHELRNPLGSIRNAAYLLQRRIPDGEAKGGRYLDIISQEVNRADRTICNLMEMSRPKDAAKVKADLGEMVRDGSVLAHIPEQVGFRTVLEPDPFPILVDPGQFRQVLGNLFTNAVQAMNGNGEIVVDARHGEDYDEIVIRDSGPGILADDRERLFEPLFTTKAKGTGLGLTICRQIVRQHGGAIDLIDPDGEGTGTGFCIRLPRRRADTRAGETGEELL